jgi:hypothetical protein
MVRLPWKDTAKLPQTQLHKHLAEMIPEWQFIDN